MRIARVLLVIVAVICLGVALSYPIRYRQAQEENDTNMEELAQMRQQARQSQSEGSQDGPRFPVFPVRPTDVPAGEGTATEAGSAPSDSAGDVATGTGSDAADRPGEAPVEASAGDGGNPSDSAAVAGSAPQDAGGEAERGDGQAYPDGAEGVSDAEASDGGQDSAAVQAEPAAPTPVPAPTPEPTREPYYWDLGKYYAATPTPSPTPDNSQAQGPTVAPTPTPDRSIRNGPLPYPLKDKVVLDKAAILPELKDIYALNEDLVGWINIPDTVIDYPVVQAENGEFYLTHDFYGEENINGQIILDVLCDPYTPSYNLVVSGHHMKNGSMFGGLPQYRVKSYWEKHPFLEFDTLMERKIYVIFACFYSADYDEDETGFRYNAIIDYKIDGDRWLAEIEENQLYDTGIEREFGDEFITLTTCDRARHRNGRFVVVGRKIREGERFE